MIQIEMSLVSSYLHVSKRFLALRLRVAEMVEEVIIQIVKVSVRESMIDTSLFGFWRAHFLALVLLLY